MSMKLVSLIWDIEPEYLNSYEKAVLQRMADFGSDDGQSIFPSIPRIARNTSISERKIQRTIKELIKRNILIKTPRQDGDRNLTNLYQINVGLLYEIVNRDNHNSKMAQWGGVQCAPGVVSSRHQGGVQQPPDPLQEPFINKTITPIVPLPGDVVVFDDLVIEVFEHWQTVLDHPKSKLDKKRRAVITKALKTYSVVDLKKAILGCKLTPFNMGDNDSGQIHDDISLICRDSARVERFLRHADHPPAPKKKNHSERENLAYQNTKERMEELAARIRAKKNQGGLGNESSVC